jgi:hypothetical protein
MPWDGNKRLEIRLGPTPRVKNASARPTTSEDPGGSVASLTIGRPNAGLHARILRPSEDDVFEIVVRGKDSERRATHPGPFAQAWLEMLALAAEAGPSEDELSIGGQAAGLLRRLLPIARNQLAAAHAMLARDDVTLENALATQLVRRLPAGFALKRRPLIENARFADAPPYLDRGGRRVALIERDQDMRYAAGSIMWRNGGAKLRAFDDPAAAIRHLFALASNDPELSAHDRLELADAEEDVASAVARAGDFSRAFGLEALMNPVALLNAQLAADCDPTPSSATE